MCIGPRATLGARAQPVLFPYPPGIAERRVNIGVVRCEQERLLERSDGIEDRPTALRGERAAAHQQLVRLHLGRGRRRRRGGKGELQTLGDRRRDFVLYDKHVHQFAVIALGPELVRVLYRDELRGDAYP